MPRSLDPRRIKLHRSYNVTEAAEALDAHKNTVRRWIGAGLPVVGGRGETLILGHELRAFLESRRAGAKRPCPPGALYCMKCRSPRRPDPDLAEYVATTATTGQLRALCPTCCTLMCRAIRQDDVARFLAGQGPTRTRGRPHLSGRTRPLVNDDSRKAPESDENAPSR